MRAMLNPVRVRHKHRTSRRLARHAVASAGVVTPLLLLGIYSGNLEEWTDFWPGLSALVGWLEERIRSLHELAPAELRAADDWWLLLIVGGILWGAVSAAIGPLSYVCFRLLLAPLPAPRPAPMMHRPADRTEPSTRHGDAVTWVVGPRLAQDGWLTFRAQTEEFGVISPPGARGGSTNVTLTTPDRTTLYGFVVPPEQETKWVWNERPGQWIARRYRCEGKTLEVAVKLPPEVVERDEVCVCLWAGGTRNRLLGVAPVRR